MTNSEWWSESREDEEDGGGTWADIIAFFKPWLINKPKPQVITEEHPTLRKLEAMAAERKGNEYLQNAIAEYKRDHHLD